MDGLGSRLPSQLEVGGPRPSSPLREAIESEGVEFEAEEVVAAEAPVVEARPADANQAVKVVAFTDGAVAAVAFGEVVPATTEQLNAFFVAHQDSPPTSISLSPGAVMITVGGESVKVRFAELEAALRRGDIAGDSQLVQAVIVAENVASLGIPPAVARPITRQFVGAISNGQSPAQARIQAYTSAVAAANLGPDPMAQLQSDDDKVTAFLRNVQRMTTPSEFQALRGELTGLIAQRRQALMSGNYAAAFDAQEQLKQAGDRHGIRGIGPQAPAQEPAAISNVAEAADACPMDPTENRFVGTLLQMGPGALLSFGRESQIGVKATVGVAAAVPVGPVAVEVAALKAELGLRTGAKVNGLVQRNEEGQFTVTFRAFAGAGAQAGGSLSAGVELANASGGKDAVGVVQTVARFANARDAAKFLAALEGGDDEQVRALPRRAPAGTAAPRPGQFVVDEETLGSGTRTQSKSRRFGLTRGHEKSTAAGGGVVNFLKRWLVPGLSTRTTASETVRFQNTQGAKVAERTYRMEKTGSSSVGGTVLKILSLGMYAGTRSRNRVELRMREVTPPAPVAQARGVQPSTLPTTFRPSLSLQIDSDKVKAMTTPESLTVLADKEFSRVMELVRSANKDAGATAIDVSEEAQSQLRTTIRLALEKIRDRINTNQMVTDADLRGWDVGVNAGVAKVSGGSSSGRMVTLQFAFAPAEGGGSRIVSDRVGLGVSTTFETRLAGSVTLGSSEIQGAPVKVGVSAFAARNSEERNFQPLQRQRAYTRLEVPQAPPQPPVDNAPQPVRPEQAEVERGQ